SAAPQFTRTYDSVAPTVASIVRAGVSPTSAASVNFTVTFSENVTGVTAATFSLTTGGTISGASVGAVIGAGAVYTVTVNTGIGDGTIRLDATAIGTVADPAGNALAGLPFAAGQRYTIDKTNPLDR